MHKATNIENFDEVSRLAHSAMTPRAIYLDLLDRYVHGTQYQGMKDWWCDDVPLVERAPCFNYLIVQSARDEIRTKTLGEGRFPDVTSRQAWDDDEDGLSEDDSELVDRAMEGCAKMARFQAVCSAAADRALGNGTAVAITSVRANRMCIDLVHPGWCDPELDDDGIFVKKLTISYPYVDTTLIIKGKVKARAFMYRRVIDEVNDTTYVPAEFKSVVEIYQEGFQREVKKGGKIAHGMGFCPVHWYAHAKGCEVESRIDGHAIHEDILQQVDGLNRTISSRHKAAFLASSPQWTETGVSPGDNPSAPGRMGHPPQIASPLSGTPVPGMAGSMGTFLSPSQGQSAARKGGTQFPWQYASKDSKVQMHTLPGDALEAISKTIYDERNKVCENLRVVFLDTENMAKGHAMSGSALDALRERFIARCDDFRRDFGDGFIIPMYGMMLRIAVKKGLPIPGLKKAQAIVERIADIWSWYAPPLELSWGAYSSPGAQDQLFRAQTTSSYQESGLLTKRAAVKMNRDIIGVEDIDGYIEELENEAKEQQQQEADAQEASAQADHGRGLEAQGAQVEGQKQLIGEKAKADMKVAQIKAKAKPSKTLGRK